MTDHKPLVPLLGKTNLDCLPPRVLRFKIRLMRFSYAIRHVAGRQIPVYGRYTLQLPLSARTLSKTKVLSYSLLTLSPYWQPMQIVYTSTAQRSTITPLVRSSLPFASQDGLARTSSLEPSCHTGDGTDVWHFLFAQTLATWAWRLFFGGILNKWSKTIRKTSKKLLKTVILMVLHASAI